MYISIRPPRAGRDHGLFTLTNKWSDFNPPAPCGAGHRQLQTDHYHRDISIRPPRAGRDKFIMMDMKTALIFQSARPVRGGTHRKTKYDRHRRNFNPPAPCGAGPNLPSQAKSTT